MNRAACGFQRFAHRYFIREVLDEQGISMAELGRRLGLSCETVSATVRGKRHCHKVLDALKALGVPPAYLFAPRARGKETA